MRRTAAPPTLDGFEYVAHLGSGGFADVYLYDQRRPSRRVAVKVLVADRLDDAARRRFDTEADLMALLSSHPNILTIYSADLTREGHPFLVMEYCPKPNLAVRYRRDPLSVSEALATGIQLAGAVESAHRAGITHRDIKPANILVTEYNRPVLADFGISVVAGNHLDAEGLSIPWAPPEAIEGTGGGASADVYSLAATVYSLLSGRHPFEVRGGDNGQAALIERILGYRRPPLGRPDAPLSLDQVLAVAMAKDPAQRYPSALAFGRALQQVQGELALAVTPLDVRDDAGHQGVGVEDETDDGEPGTRVRAVTSVSPDVPAPRPGGAVGSAPQRRRTVALAAPSRAAHGDAAQGDAGPTDTILRPSAAAADPESQPAAVGGPRRLVAWIVAGVLAIAVGIAVAVVVGGSPPPDPSDTQASAVVPADPIDALVAPIENLSGAVVDGMVTFTWTHPDTLDGDTYLWRLADAGEDEGYEPTDEPTVSFPAEIAEDGSVVSTCIEVLLRRSDGRASVPVSGCTP